MHRGLLLFAHGARDPNWARPFEAVAEQILAAQTSARGEQVQVRLAFLEFMDPGLLDAAAMLVDAGCERVDIVPLFLGTGGHVRKDLPVLLDKLREQYPRIEWMLRPAIGEAAQVVDAMAAVALRWVSLGAPDALAPASDNVTPTDR